MSKVLKVIFYQKITNLKKLHSKCKQTLCVDKQTPDILAKAKLGWYPIMSDIIKQNFRYWHNIISSEATYLTYKTLQANIDISFSFFFSFFVSISHLHLVDLYFVINFFFISLFVE